MASRPVFVPVLDEDTAGGDELFVREVLVDFKWNPGLAAVQKKKNIAALHASAAAHRLHNLLEISSKSSIELGRKLSAFSLKVEIGAQRASLEAAFQGSKKFRDGGPYVDIYEGDARSAKRDPRLKSSGPLVAFVFDGEEWPLVPKTAFYDWLYLSALFPHRNWLERLYDYDGFTDIEFNPKKSINCQARSVALLVALMRRGLLDKAMESRQAFLEITAQDSLRQPHSDDLKQGRLL